MNTRYLIITWIMISIGIVLIPAPVQAQSPNEFSISLSDPAKRGKLKASLNTGAITVKGTNRKDVLVKYRQMESKASENVRNKDKDGNDASREGLKRIGGGGLGLEATETNNLVVVRSESWTQGLNIEIEIPSGMDVQLHTHNFGDINVSNVQGELALENFNGSVTAQNVSGSVVVSTFNGSIKVVFDKVTENTPMSYSTYNGDIDVTFPASLKASLKMKTDNGELLTGFDVKLANRAPVQVKDTHAGITKVVVDDWKLADINGGGPEMTMKTYNGDILVRKK